MFILQLSVKAQASILPYQIPYLKIKFSPSGFVCMQIIFSINISEYVFAMFYIEL